MEHQQISDLPSHVKNEIAKILDAGNLWRSVINTMNPPLYNQAEIERFGMATLSPRGSPTKQLLSSLEQKNRTVAELRGWISSFGASNRDIQRLLNLLQGGGPTIQRHPVALTTGTIDSHVELSCLATGIGSLSYQWFKSRKPLQGQTQSKLHLYNLKEQDQGHYICRVADSQKHFVFTNWAKVKVLVADQVNAPPDMNQLVITVQPPQKVHVLHGGILKLYCDAVGNPPPKFQWLKEEAPIPGASDREWLKHNVCQDDSGAYRCQISNDAGESIMSTVASVIVIKEDHTELFSPRGPSHEPPKITVQPNSCVRTPYGGILSLFCDAVGSPPPKFQWLKDNAPIPGATEKEYQKQGVTQDDSGIYSCRVYDDAGEAITSEGSRVYVEKVSGKMALLIGNKDYYYADRLGPLFHPINDVCELSASLTALDFKVVSLVNLTLEEMKVALHQFCSLLDEDMCALFYFAGHGFEISGESYLIPIDATDSYSPTENMPVADVLCALQERSAKLNVILLDCCRTTPSTVLHVPARQPQSRVHQKNVVVASGCCPQGCVYESQNEKNGFFVLHLIRHISKTDLDVEMLLRRVSEGVKNENLIDRKTGMQQIVHRSSTLSVNHMSLATPVSPNVDNPYIAAKMAKWKSAHEVPEQEVPVFEGDGVLVKLQFLAELSNKMIVNARVYADEDRDVSVKFNMPKNVSGCGIDGDTPGKAVEAYSGTNGVDASVHVTDLQRLLGNLVLRLMITYTLNDQEKQVQVEYVVPGKPLYAKLVSC